MTKCEFAKGKILFLGWYITQEKWKKSKTLNSPKVRIFRLGKLAEKGRKSRSYPPHELKVGGRVPLT